MVGWLCGSRVGVGASQPLSRSSIGSVINDVGPQECRGNRRSWVIHRYKDMCKRKCYRVGWLSTHMDAEDVGVLQAVVRVW